MEVGGQCHDPAVFTPGKDPVPIVQKAGWAPGPVWTGAEYLAPTGFRSTDRLSGRCTDRAVPAHPPYRTEIKCVWVYAFLRLYDDSRIRRGELLIIPRCGSSTWFRPLDCHSWN